MIAEPREAEDVLGRRGLTAQRPNRVDAGRERLRDPRGLRQRARRRCRPQRRGAGPDDPERTERRHELRPVDQREPFLRAAATARSRPGPAPPARQELALEPRLPHRSAATRDARAAPGRRWPRRSPGSAPRENTSPQTLEEQVRDFDARPETPVARLFCSSTSAARTISSGYGSPTP